MQADKSGKNFNIVLLLFRLGRVFVLRWLLARGGGAGEAVVDGGADVVAGDWADGDGGEALGWGVVVEAAEVVE